jgi:hypothetical protein
MQPRLNRPLQPTIPLMPQGSISWCDSIAPRARKDSVEMNDYGWNERQGRTSYLKFILTRALQRLQPVGGVFPWGANRSILFSMVMVGWVVP